MREILFEGKRVDNGEWIEGYYLYSALANFKNPTAFDSIFRHWIVTPAGKVFKVDYKTVGEFTGLLDKDGKKIFEGDLLLDNGGLIWLVAFENGAFVCKDETSVTYFNFYEHSDYDSKTKSFKSYISNYKKIGNIHDNPEFLKRGGDAV